MAFSSSASSRLEDNAHGREDTQCDSDEELLQEALRVALEARPAHPMPAERRRARGRFRRKPKKVGRTRFGHPSLNAGLHSKNGATSRARSEVVATAIRGDPSGSLF